MQGCYPFLAPLLFSLKALEFQYQPKAVHQMTCSSFGSSMKISNTFVASRQNQHLKHGQTNSLPQNVLITTTFVVHVIFVIYKKWKLLTRFIIKKSEAKLHYCPVIVPK